jgi:probable HAF family extracellular repeat protein
MKRIVLVLILALLGVGNACAALEQPCFTLTWLGNLAWGDTYVNAMNDSGQVIGYSFKYIPSIDRWRERAFVWQNGVVQDLGTLGDDDSRCWASGINNNGQIVGYSNGGPCMWQNGGIQPLQNAPLGLTGRAINDAGQVVAGSYLWENGVVTNLGGLGSSLYTEALDINNSGLVVGYSSTAAQTVPWHAFIWKQGRMTDLGTLGGPFSTATAINSAGVMVGYSDYVPGSSSFPRHAFLWEDWLMHDLGTVGGAASSSALDTQ